MTGTGRAGLEPATNGFGFGGSRDVSWQPVISQCRKGLRCRLVPNDGPRIPAGSRP
ncbi:Protein of unknown function [Mycobacterium canettii CIPT 140070017]|nr:Protein of unknown function [Mycobacterium canettii CIPT 140070017]